MTPEQIRLQLLANGYTPIRNHDKRTFMEGWPKAVITEDEIRRWTRRFSRDTATGIRVENGLMVIDFDIDDRSATDAIYNAVMDAVPALADGSKPLLVRTGKGAKEAWYVRCEELFGRIFSHGWVRPGETEDDGVHRVEIFGGGMPRQFGSFGPHTKKRDDGEVLVSYSWQDKASPLDVRQSELQLLTKDDCFLICDTVDRELAALGWQQVLLSKKGEGDGSRVYDLTDDMFFDLNTGERVSLQHLRGMAAEGVDGVRCSASWLEGPGAVNRSRCIIGHDHAGRVTVWESSNGETHFEKAFAPREYEADLTRLRERLAEVTDARRNRIQPTDRALVAATKMLQTYAYCAHPAPLIYPLDARSLDAGLTIPAMRFRMMPNCDVETGQRGGRTVTNPLDIFMGSEQRIEVAGARLRPDQPARLYEEDGKKWINIYHPPVHDATGGSPDVGITFLEHLLPDPDERRWFSQWLGYKLRHPHVPGPAVLMVARNFGTGRGTLGTLVSKLMGAEYVTTLPFHMFAGKSYQSQYDDWGAETLMAVITEASEAGDTSKFVAKHDTYTHIKSLVEPSADGTRRYVSKKQHFRAKAFTSYLIATNDVDALPIPAHDRRFAVLSNGDAGDPEFWIMVNRWMADPANVAAFYHYLCAVDMTGYSPFEAPPKTEAQVMMAALGRSALDHCIDEAFARLLSPAYTVEQIARLVEIISREDDTLELPDHWRKIIRREVIKRSYRVGVPNGINWQPLINGTRTAVFARTKKDADTLKLFDKLREEVGLNNQKSDGEKLSSLGEKVVRLKTPPR